MTKATARGVIAVAGLALLLGATAASADPIKIDSFSYTSNIGFSAWSPSSVAASNPYGADASVGGESKLTWGKAVNTNTSSLDLTDPNISGTVVVDSTTPVDDAVITHHNYVITGDSLETATIMGAFKLTVATPTPGGATIPKVFTPFNIAFQETDNLDGDGSNCAVAPDAGFIPCPDIFVLTNPDVITATFHGSDFGSQYAGYDYTLKLGTIEAGVFTPLEILPNAACGAVGVGNGCQGFVTQENADTTKKFGFIITSSLITKVPEPTPIALFGLGLLMLGVMLRYRRRTGHTD